MSWTGQAPPADSVRAVLERVFADPKYDWRERPASPFAWLRELWHDFLEWLVRLEEHHPIVYWVLLFAMLVLSVTLLVHLGYLVYQSLKPRVAAGDAAGAAVGTPRDARWHRAEAARLAGEGRFAEALGHYFTALVLDLDHRRVVTFHPSKTPAEYVTEARLDGDARGALAALVQTLYRHLFGGAPCGPDDVRVFVARADALTAHGAAG